MLIRSGKTNILGSFLVSFLSSYIMSLLDHIDSFFEMQAGLDSKARKPGFKSWLYQLLAVYLGSYLTSLTQYFDL